MLQVEHARSKRQRYPDLWSCFNYADEVSAVIIGERQILPPLRRERSSCQKASSAYARKSSSTLIGESRSAGGSAFSVISISSNSAYSFEMKSISSL